MLRSLVVLLAVASVDAGTLPALKLRGGKAADPPLFGLSEGLPSLSGAGVMGGLLGYTCGKAANVAAQGVAVGVGCVAAAATLLSKLGYITVHYTKVEADIKKLLDLNKDGQVDSGDYDFASAKIVKFMTDNGLGSASGFAAGFYAGFTGKGPLP